MYEKPCVNDKVEPRSTFMFTSDLPYIVSNLFTHVKPVKVCIRTHMKITRQWKSILSLKKDIIKIQGVRVEPHPLAPQAGIITTTLPASWLLEAENFETVKCYPYYFITAN